MSEYETIRVERDDAGVVVLTFDRPEVRNALNLTMVDDIRRALNRLALEGDVAAVIFTGAGDKAFLGGADIGELRDRRRADALRRINSALFREIESFPAPTIAAIRGFALGGGCELAMACDLRVAGEGAKLGQPEVGLGILPGAGATYRMPRLVGLGVARDLIFTGRIIDAAEAQRIGLVNRVVPDAEVVDAARAFAGEVARNSQLAVRLAKQALNLSREVSVDAAQAFESTAQAVLFEDEEKIRRMTAFLERKRGRKQPLPHVALRGAVADPGTLDFPTLAAVPPSGQVDDAQTVCPGRVGRGVRLDVALASASPTADASLAAFADADGTHTAEVPRALWSQALLVYSHHGQPLPAEHGGPFRLVLPEGSDPCQHLKHVASIELR